MLNKIFQKVTGFLQDPPKAYSSEKKTEIMEAFLYMAVLSVVLAVLSGAVSLILSPGVFTVELIFIGYVSVIVLMVILGLWLHLWAYIFGAKRGLLQTLKIVFYGGTPIYLLGWLPLIGTLAWLWSFFLDWKGLQNLQGMSGDNAAYAILIAFVIPLTLVLLLAAFALFYIIPNMNFAGFSQGF